MTIVNEEIKNLIEQLNEYITNLQQENARLKEKIEKWEKGE